MAVILESWGVVARRETVEAKLPGGLAGWFEVVPHRMACADPHLCFAAFMASEDAWAFVVKLDGLGLVSERDGVFRDVALVGVDGVWQHQCTWVEVGRHAGVTAAWSKGAERDPLVVPARWRPGTIFNLSNEESARRLTFVRREGGVEVFVDVETGQEVYRGRSGPSHEMEPAIEARFQAAVESIESLLTFGGPPRKLGWFERRRLAKGIKELEAIAEGDRWRVWWFLGMARRCGGDPDGALAAFEHAHAANPSDIGVGRELGGQYLALGRGQLAVTVCGRMCAVAPGDAGLRANLALAYVVADDMKRAKAEATRALAMDPSDEITRRVVTMIDDVITGKRARPTKIA